MRVLQLKKITALFVQGGVYIRLRINGVLSYFFLQSKLCKTAASEKVAVSMCYRHSTIIIYN